MAVKQNVSRAAKVLGLGAVTAVGLLLAGASPADAAPNASSFRSDRDRGSYSSRDYDDTYSRGNSGTYRSGGYSSGGYSSGGYSSGGYRSGGYGSGGYGGNWDRRNSRTGPNGDFDRDGIKNSRDWDIDGDGISNRRDRNDYSRDRRRGSNWDNDSWRNGRRDRDNDSWGNGRDRDDYYRNRR